ncbi:MAG: sigma-70 family RNA polymerase sigma factor [Proteobacteria bacterium]|nr:sigma-70 family RNA polymerase sigma factor [Pseudomonadota bacterium]
MESEPQNLRQATDEELMVFYQRGQMEAFEILYQRHGARVYGFFRSRLQERAWVEDVHQATFMKLHQARHQYDPSFPFGPWLFTICRSALFDFLRSRQRLNQREILDSEALENAHAAQETEVALDLPELGALPSKQRQVLEMRYLEDLSFDEIAHRLETSPTNVRQWVSRAVRKLKSIVKDQGGE